MRKKKNRQLEKLSGFLSCGVKKLLTSSKNKWYLRWVIKHERDSHKAIRWDRDKPQTTGISEQINLPLFHWCVLSTAPEPPLTPARPARQVRSGAGQTPLCVEQIHQTSGQEVSHHFSQFTRGRRESLSTSHFPVSTRAKIILIPFSPEHQCSDSRHCFVWRASPVIN